MISNTVHEYQLSKGYHKVQYVHTAIQNSIVFLAKREAGFEVLVHCNQQGKVVLQHTFEHMTDSLALPTPYQVIVLQTRANSILHLDLLTHRVTLIPFEFMRQSTEQSLIYCFSQSKLICVSEWGLRNDPRLKLSYFKTPLLKDSEPFVVYQSKDDEWTYEYYVKRANNTSMVVWFKARQEEFQIRLFEIFLGEEKGAMRIVSSNKSFASLYSLSASQCDILDIWQTIPGSFMLVLLTSHSDMVKHTDKAQVSVLYILDTIMDIFRECKFNIPKPYNDLIIDHFYIGYYSMVRTFGYDNSRAKQTPIFYICNRTEELVGMESWEISHMFKQTIPGYDGNTLCSCEYDNEDVHMIKVTIKTPSDPRMMGLHLLLEMFEDFDEDFLQEALNFLPSPLTQK